MTLHERDDLFETHKPLAIFLARAVGASVQGSLGEDLEQEALLALWDSSRHFDGRKHPGVTFPHYARRVIKNALLDAIVKEHRHGFTGAPLGVKRDSIDVDTLAKDSPRGDLADVLFDAINSLDPMEKQLLSIRAGVDGSDPKTLIESASECGLPFGTAKRMMGKIRESIRTELQRQGLDPEKWVTVFPRKASISVV